MDSESIRDEKVKALRSVVIPSPDAVLTDVVRKNGLSTFTNERLDQILTQISDALGVKKPAAGDIWVPDYLPAKEELRLQ